MRLRPRIHMFLLWIKEKSISNILKSAFLTKHLCSVSLCHNLVAKHLDFSPAVPLGRHIWAPNGILGQLKAAQGQVPSHTMK